MMFSTLSEVQRQVVFDKTGKFVVRACPGSGKTYCVAARLRRLLDNWDKEYRGIATISFTNTAWLEIENKVSNEFQHDKGISFPHFLGTIDSFINRYIFLPHGHLILKCGKRPTLVGEPHGAWSGFSFYDRLFDNMSYNIDGSLYAFDKRIMPEKWEENTRLIDRKKSLNQVGFANQSDANYFAMQILQKYPKIAHAIALRFPFLIIDEAQDTSETQMRIIDLLIENGLEEVMMMGDPDQAIFEWNEANPDLLNNKFQEWRNSIELNENRRSSQSICNTTYRLSSLNNISQAVNTNVKDFEQQPQIVLYNNNLPQVVEDFLLKCQQSNINISKENVSVLYRSKSIKNEIIELPETSHSISIWNKDYLFTKNFAKGKFLYDNGSFKKGTSLIEKEYIKQHSRIGYCNEKTIADFIDKHGFIRFRKFIYDFIHTVLPGTNNKTLGEWINEANINLEERNVQFRFKSTKKGADLTFKQIFLEEDITKGLNYRVDTIHGVKGETFDASLVILKKKGIGKYYKTLLKDNIPVSESEELRIAYVGMTRPRKILVIAVPDEDNKKAWEEKLGLGYDKN